MSEPQKNVGRSVWSIVAGFLAVVVLSIGTDAILHATGIFPALGKQMSNGLFILATVYRTVFGLAGSYFTARLAPGRPMKHAMIGAAIGFVLATAGAVAAWNKDLGPHWYPVALVLTVFPTAWIGARVYLTQNKLVLEPVTRWHERQKASEELTCGGAGTRKSSQPEKPR